MGIHVDEARIEPTPPGRFQLYMLHRGRYLELCWKYRLEPRDLSIPDLLEIEFERHEDKVRLVKLILKLCSLEKELVNVLDDPLFPETICEIEKSGILRPVKH